MEWNLNDATKHKLTEMFIKNCSGAERVSIVIIFPLLLGTGKSRAVAEQLWLLVDQDRLGRISFGEFMVAFHIAENRTPGEAIPDAIPETLLPFLDLLPPLPVEDADIREECLLRCPEALDTGLARSALRFYSDPFPVLADASLRIIAYLCINAYGLNRIVSQRCDVEVLMTLFRSRVQEAQRGALCATILASISACKPDSFESSMPWMSRHCLPCSNVPVRTRNLLMCTVANCAAFPTCARMIIQSSLTRSSPPWLTSFVNEFQSTCDETEWTREAVRFILNLCICDSTIHKEVLLSQFLHYLIARIGTLCSEGIAYTLELGVVLSRQDPSVFNLVFKEFRILGMIDWKIHLQKERVSDATQRVLFFLRSATEDDSEFILKTKEGVGILSHYFEHPSKYPERKEIVVQILNSILGRSSREDMSDLGLEELVIRGFKIGIKDDEMYAQYVECMKKLHAEGCLNDGIDLLSFFFENPIENVIELSESISRTCSVSSALKLNSIIAHIVQFQSVDHTGRGRFMKCLHILLSRMHFDIHVQLQDSIVRMLEQTITQSTGQCQSVALVCLAHLVTKSPKFEGILEVIPVDELVNLLKLGDVNDSTGVLTALVRIARETRYVEFVVDLTRCWYESRSSITSEKLQLIAMLLYGVQWLQSCDSIVAILLSVLPAKPDVRNLVVVCLSRILEISEITLSSPRINYLLQCVLKDGINPIIREFCCRIIISLWCSRRCKPMFIASNAVPHAIFVLLLSDFETAPIGLVASIAFPAIDFKVSWNDAHDDGDLLMKFASTFRTSNMLERIADILSRKFFLGVSDLCAEDIRAVCFLRIISRMFTDGLNSPRLHHGIHEFLTNTIPKHLLLTFPISTMFHYKKPVRDEYPLQVHVLLDVIFYLRTCFLGSCRQSIISESSTILDRIRESAQQPGRPMEPPYNVVLRNEMNRMIECVRMRGGM